ncbi:DUF4440 domain-containing protein [Caenorhabditis elegans]|uniref:DUF4440 domain-containing protein n=1 Tax=Caenorhabditis elegans TaxID=6239 RepID=O01516_CAEEL|nr:DUF4440 domain-containing protein [Caenorhabditis elegans]CCD67765.1 DUF4440 domain-containing protein [Caenorhabditis elegans]|eukprot:NP_504945.2 Uncharacterized protein CELE_F19F10.3 [Caenorhabditis elegans]
MSLEEFKKLRNEIKELKNAGKHEEFVERFAAKDATFLAPFHDPVTAADSISLAKSDDLAPLVKADFEMTTDEVTQIGDVVIERNTIIVKLPSGDKTGWALSVWVKEDGNWKIRNSCVTFKAPAPQ